MSLIRPRPTRFVHGALLALLLAPVAEASLTRSSAPSRQTPALVLSLAAPEPSEFSLFEGDEIARALAPRLRLVSISTDEDAAPAPRARFEPASELIVDEFPDDAPELVQIIEVREQRFRLDLPRDVFSLEPLRGPPSDEASYPKTRYRVFGLLGTPILGELRGVSLELHWRSAAFSAGLASGSVGWLSQDPLGDKDSPNLYGFVKLRPHELTDPMGLATPITAQYSTAVNEALNPSNSPGARMTFGVLALLAAPAAGLEQVADTLIDTPGRMWRSSKGVVSETQATFAARDADERLRHGSAAVGHASQLFLDATVVEGVVESALVRAAQRKVTQAAAARAGESVAPAAGPPARPAWQTSEKTAGEELKEFGFKEQKSYLAGEEVRYGTPGSVRPDLSGEAFKLTVDVKNYNVTTPQGRYNLVKDVIEQVPSRAANLPTGTRQGLILDIRGQSVRQELLDAMIQRIVTRSNGAISAENIVVLR